MGKEKIGIVDVGGGFRGIYAAGVMDFCMDNNIKFDLGIGVSAGSANIISYAAGQRGRNFKFYTQYGRRRQYASITNFVFKRSFIDLDYVYSTLSNSDGECPFNYPAAVQNPMEFVAVATDALTGEATYFTKQDMAQDSYDIIKASCAIPFFCPPYQIKGIPYYDGALSDTIPFQKAFDMGCQRVVLILTLPESKLRSAERDCKIAKRIRKKYPLAAQKLQERAERYNGCVQKARQLREQGKLIIISPDDTFGVGTLTRDQDALKKLYQEGYDDGRKIVPFLD